MRSCAAGWRSAGSRVPGLRSPRRIAVPSRSTVCSNVVGGWTGLKIASSAGLGLAKADASAAGAIHGKGTSHAPFPPSPRTRLRWRAVDRRRQTLRTLALAAAGAVVGAALWWRQHPSACPYSQRFWVELPHPFITRERLREALGPRPGELLLEVGPGTGHYTLAVAEWLGPQGRLRNLDGPPQKAHPTPMAP